MGLWNILRAGLGEHIQASGSLLATKQLPQDDHVRLALIEQRVDITLAHMRQAIEVTVRQVEFTDDRLNEGNKNFRDLDLFKQQTNEAITQLRNEWQATRLTANNADRAVLQQAQLIDSRTRQAEDDKEKLRDELLAAFQNGREQSEKKYSERLDRVEKKLEDTIKIIDTWMIQGRMIRLVWVPIGAALTTVFITLVMRYVFPA